MKLKTIANHGAMAHEKHPLGDLRRERGLTQQQLANASGLPLTTIQKLESGVNKIGKARVDTVIALAKAFDMTVEELVEYAG